MKQPSNRKKELDQMRTEWRKTHRTLNGKIILYPDKPPEHINARGSKIYNWFWKKMLLETEQQEIPALISALKNRIKTESDPKKIQGFRTMIAMAEDCYQLKQLEDIDEFDTELQLEKKPIFNSEEGVIHRNGSFYTTDYNEDESEILLRDVEGIIIDVLSTESKENAPSKTVRHSLYKDWDYMEK